MISGPGASPDFGESTIVSGAVANGSVFVAGGATTDGFPGAIAALDPATGVPRWLMHPDGFVLPALTAVGEVLLAGVSHNADSTGKLYVPRSAHRRGSLHIGHAGAHVRRAHLGTGHAVRHRREGQPARLPAVTPPWRGIQKSSPLSLSTAVDSA